MRETSVLFTEQKNILTLGATCRLFRIRGRGRWRPAPHLGFQHARSDTGGLGGLRTRFCPCVRQSPHACVHVVVNGKFFRVLHIIPLSHFSSIVQPVRINGVEAVLLPLNSIDQRLLRRRKWIEWDRVQILWDQLLKIPRQPAMIFAKQTYDKFRGEQPVRRRPKMFQFADLFEGIKRARAETATGSAAENRNVFVAKSPEPRPPVKLPLFQACSRRNVTSNGSRSRSKRRKAVDTWRALAVEISFRSSANWVSPFEPTSRCMMSPPCCKLFSSSTCAMT